jgi:hypothetical protein
MLNRNEGAATHWPDQCLQDQLMGRTHHGPPVSHTPRSDPGHRYCYSS